MEYTATITAIEYEDTAEFATVTPLGVKQASVFVLDNVRLALDVGELVGHVHVCKPEAIGTRIAIYGLPDERAALEALVREVVFSWSGLEPETDDQIGQLGGVDSRIAVEWAEVVRLEPLIALLRERIEAARERYLHRGPPLPE